MSQTEQRRYIIVGAGAIGGTVAALLARSGQRVVLVARGDNAVRLAAFGMTLTTPDEVVQVPVQTVSDARGVHLTDYDVLVFATKTQQLHLALLTWVDLPVHDSSGAVAGTVGERLPILTALNGVVAEQIALRYCRRVLGVCVWMPAVHLDPGHVAIRSWPVAGQFHISRWPASLTNAADDDLIAEISQTWSPGGILVRPVRDVAPWKYNKLLTNLGNAVEALAVGPGTGVLAKAVRYEGERVLNAAGIPFVPFTQSEMARADGPTIRAVPGAQGGPGNSTWQSLQRGTGNIETDFLNGEIVRLAHQHGLAAPLNAALVRIARATVGEGHGPGAYSVRTLAEALGLPLESTSAETTLAADSNCA